MASSVPEEKKVKRIVKVLKQIAENLNQDEIISLRTSIQSAIKLTRNYDENKVRTLLEMCVKTLFFRPGISGNLIKQSMRSILMILKNEQLGNIVIERFTDYILREHSSIAIGMEWDDDLLKAYFKALGNGHESAQHARFMVVGMFKAGKTTLVSKLLGRPEPPPNSSTVFIDISVDTCEIDGDGKWKEMTFEEREKRYRVRLHEMFESNKKQDVTTSDRSGSGIPDQVDQGVHMEGETLNKDEKNMSMLKKELNKATSDNTPKPSGYYKTIEEANDNPDLEKRPTVAIWDFAGQSVYYSTHQFFLNPRTIYLLVLDLSKDLNEKVDEGRDAKGLKNLYIGNNQATYFTQLDAFQFWMRSIYVYTKQKDTQNKYTPTIVLVGTHKDACDGENADAFAEKYFENALKPFDNSTLKDLIYKKKFFVSKDESSDVFDSLRAELNTIATKQPFWKEPIPAKFIPLEREVEKKKSNGAEILQFNELETTSEDSHYQLTHEEIQVFLGFQHAFGNILYYQKANPDTIILHPKWIINALKMFVTHRDDLRSEEWTLFTKMGILSETLIEKLLQAEDAYWVPFKEKIICYMEHLDIIAKPVRDDTHYTDDTQKPQCTSILHVKINRSKTIRKADFYLMPLRFPSRPSKEEIKVMLGCTDRNKWVSSPVLCMYIKDVFLPPFVFHRILATCIKDMQVAKHKGNHVLFDGFGAFQIDATTKLTTWSWDDMIYVKVTSYHEEKMSQMETADLQDVQTYFENLVKHAFATDVSSHGKSIEISHYVTCPKCPEHFPFDKETDKEGFPLDQKVGLLLVDNLRIIDDAQCDSYQHHVAAREALKNWFPDVKKIKVDAHLKKADLDERSLADLSEVIDSEKLYILASWLNIQERELQRIKKKYQECEFNVTFHILYEWKKRHESLAILLPAVEAAGCKKEDFDRIRNKIDNDHTKTRLNEITQQLSPEKLEEIELGESECLTIANFIGTEYWLLGIRLGVPDVHIQRLTIEKETDTEKIIHNILLKWHRNPNGQTNREINEELIRAMVKSCCEMEGVIKIFGK